MIRSLLAVLLALAAPALALAQSSESIAPRTGEELRLSYAPIVERAAPAVVNIYTRRVVRTAGRSFRSPMFEFFFGEGASPFETMPRERVENSLGSGVIVSPDGVIVTNNHVIANKTEIKIVLTDRREFEAEVVLADEKTDLAVLQIDADEPLPYLAFSDSDAAEVGDVVLAIGNPFGVGQTVTSGIVSALARTSVGVTDYQFFIQTDAAINPGNSGGALVDAGGKLVGVNTAIFSRSGGSNGIGFAIPSNLVKQVIASAVSGSALIRPWLGAKTETVTPDIAMAVGLDRPAGAMIADIFKGGPAEKAGLKPGDVVIEFGGQPVLDEAGLRYRVATQSAGSKAEFTYVRDGKERMGSAIVSAPPEKPRRDDRALSGRHPLNDVRVANLSPAFNEELGRDPFETGVVVLEASRGSYAGRRGLRRGDRIVALDGDIIESVQDLERRLERSSDNWRFEIERSGRVYPWSVNR